MAVTLIPNFPSTYIRREGPGRRSGLPDGLLDQPLRGALHAQRRRRDRPRRRRRRQDGLRHAHQGQDHRLRLDHVIQPQVRPPQGGRPRG